jgi:hypothetical protein
VSIERYKSTWRGTTFNPQYDDSGLVDDPAHLLKAQMVLPRYVLDEVNTQRLSAQDYRELRQFGEGAEPNEAFEGVRAITAKGTMFGTNIGNLEDLAWGLNELFSIAAVRAAAVGATPKGLLPFSFRRAITDGVTSRALRFYCRPGTARPVWIGRRGSGLARPFSWQLIAFDPFAYDDVATNTNLGNLAGGANNVANPGNLYTKPTIVITFSGAGGAAVVLTNTTTGKTFTMDLSAFIAAQTLTLNPSASTMVRNDGTDMYSKRVAGFLSDFVLNPGANNITWSAGGGITSVQFQVRGAYA